MEEYFDPEMEIIEFDAADIITASGGISTGTTGGGWDPDGGFGWEEEEEEPW